MGPGRPGAEQRVLAVGLASERLQAPSGCRALVLSAGLSHAADEITEVPARDESESRSKPNIWTSLAPRGAGDLAASEQPASSQPRGRF